MTSRLADAARKIKRAQAHLYEIEQAIDTFAGTAFESLTRESDPETGERFFVLHELRHPDVEVGLLIGDCLNNLRSALDHLAFQLVKHPAAPVSGQRTKDRHIQFPICDDTPKFEDSLWRIRGAMPEAVAVIEGLQPYPGRQSPFTLQPSHLGLLRDLNDWDKHRLLHVIENDLAWVGFLHPERVASWTPRDPGPLEAPTEIVRYQVAPGLDPEVEVGFYLTTNVTFEGGPGDGRVVKILLAEMRYEVSQTLARLAAYVAA